MGIQFKRFPVDIILFMLWSILLIPVALLNFADLIRILLGLPFLLFIPGYMLIFILFPIKPQYSKFTTLERIGLSFGLSIAIVSLVGILLNLTEWGIQLITVLLSQFILIESLGIIAFFRWKTESPEKRFTLSIDLSQFKSSSPFEKILSLLVILSMFFALSSVVYIVVQPKMGESFTDFYILSQTGEAINFPQDLAIGQDASLILGIINHEEKKINYTIEVWLIDEVQTVNSSNKKTQSVYNHAWFMDLINIAVDPTEITNKKNEIQKWEQNYTFSITKKGHFKVAFLLFTTPSESYDSSFDYSESIEQKINNAYRELHIWIYVG